jgi:hypothetical protein
MSMWQRDGVAHFFNPNHLLLDQTYNRIQLIDFCNLLVNHLLPLAPLA